MDLLSLSQSFDDSTVSVLAMLVGIAGGWTITSIHQQLKARRVKVSRKPNPTLRKSD